MKKLSTLLMLLLMCIWGGVKCDAQNLTVTQTPEVGHTYVFQNANNTKFYLGQKLDVTVNQYWGMPCTDESSLTRNLCWTVEAGATANTYRFRNAASGCYLYGNPGIVNYAGKPYYTSSEPYDFSLFTNASYADAVAIGTDNEHCIHMPNSGNDTENNKGLVCWTSTDAKASNWYMKDVTGDFYNNLAAVDEVTAEAVFVYAKPYSSLPFTTITEAKATFTSAPSEATLDALKQAVEQYHYVRIVSKSKGDQLSVQADGSHVRHYAASQSDASQVWELRRMNTSAIGLYNPNAGKYMGATSAGQSCASTTDAVSACTITFEQNTGSNGGFYVKSNGNKMCCEVGGGDGKINHWNTNNDNAVLWTINPATDIEVALTAVGDNTYATSYLPFAVQSVSGATAYTGVLNADHTAINMTSVDGYAANEGVVLVGESGQTTAILTFGGTAVKNEANVFTGTHLAKTVSDANRDNLRVLGVKDGTTGEIGFFKPSTSLTGISANRAFIDATGTNSTSLLSVNFGTVEGISDVLTGTVTALDANQPLYDLSGRHVVNPTKGGIYIQAGRKFIVK